MGGLIGSIFQDAKCARYNGSDETSTKTALAYGADTQGAVFIRVRLGSLITSGSKSIIGFGSDSSSDLISFRQLRNASTGSNNRLQVIKTGTGASNYFGSTNLVAGTWFSLVCQSNGSAYSIYYNGVAETLTNISGTNSGAWLGTLAANRQLGFPCQFSISGVGNLNDCDLNEGMYFNRALTGAEITWLHNGGVARNPHRYDWAGALKSWWRFGDSRDDGSMIYDEIGSEHLTNANMDSSNYVTP